MSGTLTVVEDVNKKNTKAGPCWEVTLLGGTVASTFDEDIGTTAEGLKGQSVSVELNVKKSGRYTNTFLEAIEAVEGGDAQPQAVPAPAGQYKGGGDDETAQRIARTSGLRMAVDESIAAGQPGVVDFDVARGYTNYILTGEQPAE
jgi:hypothetical protein